MQSFHEAANHGLLLSKVGQAQGAGLDVNNGDIFAATDRDEIRDFVE